jgi:polar amino acid transport system substrate-binding protein
VKPARFLVTLAAAAMALSTAACSSSNGQSAQRTAGADTAETSAGASNSPSAPSTDVVATSSDRADASSLRAELPDGIKSSGVIKVGGPVNAPPNIFLGADGSTPTGYMIDIAHAVADTLGVKISFAQMPFPSLITGLQANKIDMTLTVSDQPARQATLSFADIGDDGIVFLVAKGNPQKITSLDSLCGKSWAVISGSVAVKLMATQQTKCAAEGKPAIDVKQFSGASDAELQIRSGHVAGFCSGLLEATYTAKTTDSGSVYDVAPGGPYTSQPYALAVLKSNTGLLNALQGALQLLSNDGSLKAIAAKYGITSGLYSTIPINVAK